MTHLSVNLNKIALLRNSRGRNFPAPEAFGEMALRLGAHGLTIHPRPDQRHARWSDLLVLKELTLKAQTTHPEVEFNVEGYPSDQFLEHVLKVSPDQCTLVPDPPEALTSDAGWDFSLHKDLLTHVTKLLQSKGIRVSLFMDAFSLSDQQKQSLAQIKPDRVELYTEKFAMDFETPNQDQTIFMYKEASKIALDMGIEVNAGHDLNLKNLKTFLSEVPDIKEVSIGHALIVESLLDGFETTIKNYLKIVE